MFIIAIACIVGVASAAPSWPAAPIAAIDSVSIPRYNFNYAVSDPHTGDNKAQTEVRDGGYVKGSYSLSEPDGTIRVVDYSADPASGFNAVVKRLGPAVHPQQLYTAPIYTKQVVAPIAAPVWGQYPALSNVRLGYGYGYEGLAGLGHNGIGLNGIGLNGLGLNGIGLNGIGLNGLGLNGIGLGGGGYWKH